MKEDIRKAKDKGITLDEIQIKEDNIDATTVYDNDTKTIDFRKASVNNMKTQRRVTLPKPADEDDEFKLKVLKENISNTVKEYINDFCVNKIMKMLGFPWTTR